MNVKMIKFPNIFQDYEPGREHFAFYIKTQQEFVQVIWCMIERCHILPIGYGSWNQKYAKEDFFEQDWKAYLMYDSCKEFEQEGWYVIQCDRQKSESDNAICITSIEKMKQRSDEFFKQFMVKDLDRENGILAEEINKDEREW